MLTDKDNVVHTHTPGTEHGPIVALDTGGHGTRHWHMTLPHYSG